MATGSDIAEMNQNSTLDHSTLASNGLRPRRKRARRVCVHCHNAKLKCDLEQQSVSGNETARCTNCVEAESVCEYVALDHATISKQQD